MIKEEIELAAKKHSKLLLVISNPSSIDGLMSSIELLDIPVINVSLLLAEQLRLITIERRPLEVGKILRSLIRSESRQTVFLNHIEYLFDVELKQDPMRLLENISRNKTLIIHWPGNLYNGILVYAIPEHPEYYECDKSYLNYIIEI